MECLIKSKLLVSKETLKLVQVKNLKVQIDVYTLTRILKIRLLATPEDARKTVSKVKELEKLADINCVGGYKAGKKQQAMIAKKGKEAIRKAHGTKKVKEVLGLGLNKNGELSLVKSLQKLENVIYQRKLLKVLVLQNMLQLLKRNEKILKKVNNILNNLNELLRKYESTGKYHE